MKVFYDAEFDERGPQIPIKPISFAFVAEDGRELYVINEESLSNVMRSPWLSINVRPSLPIYEDQRVESGFITSWDPGHPEYENVLSLDTLVARVREFLLSIENLELWAHLGAYDHVALLQLFGEMAQRPAGIPMFTHELQQLMDTLPGTKIPSQPEIAHHALWDARWARDVYFALAAPLPAVVLSTTEPPPKKTYDWI